MSHEEKPSHVLIVLSMDTSEPGNRDCSIWLASTRYGGKVVESLKALSRTPDFSCCLAPPLPGMEQPPFNLKEDDCIDPSLRQGLTDAGILGIAVVLWPRKPPPFLREASEAFELMTGPGVFPVGRLLVLGAKFIVCKEVALAAAAATTSPLAVAAAKLTTAPRPR